MNWTNTKICFSLKQVQFTIDFHKKCSHVNVNGVPPTIKKECFTLLKLFHSIAITRNTFLWLFLGCNQHWAGGFMVDAVLCPGSAEGLTGSGSGLKCLRRRATT